MAQDTRLPTHLWTSALLRQWNAEGFPAVLLTRGDRNGGSVIICVDRCNGRSILLGERRDLDGNRQWMGLGSGQEIPAEEEATYLEKARKRDRDLWVLSVECAAGWPPLNAPLDPALMQSPPQDL